MNKRNLSTKTLLKNTVAAVSETITKHIPLKKFATTHGIRFYSDLNNPIINKKWATKTLYMGDDKE